MATTKDIITHHAKEMPVDDQLKLAKALAANCGYQLVPEDNERSLEIKTLINDVKDISMFTEDEQKLIIEGLEGLLK